MTQHPLLLRQLRRTFGGPEGVPHGLERFLEQVSASYQQFDQDRKLTDHAMSVSSLELATANAGLHAQNQRNEAVLARLRQTIGLLHPDGGAGEAAGDDLLGLADAIERLVTERQSIERALRQAKDAADAASRAKSEFLANMSHEIRTPLNGIIGTVNLLKASCLDPRQLHYANLASTSGENLLELINDILDFSKIEAGKLAIETLDFDLGRLLTDLAGGLSLRAEQKKLTFTCEAAADVPLQLQGDPNRVRQVLLNLTGNALKFTGTGEVAVRIQLVERNADSAQLRFSVRDTGIGIAADKLGELFQKFTQADASTTRKFGGTGLGLAICKQLVELMGGQIGVTSREGAGAEFWFTLRLAVQQAPAVMSGAAAAEPVATAKLALLPGQKSARVLVAEDNFINQEIIRALLGLLGLAPELVGDGLEAVRAVNEGNYDLVFMDMQMPELDGYEATQRIRAAATGRARVPIIAMTANAMIGDREKCLKAGMDDYISKPIDTVALVGILQRWLPVRD
jgi:signal transduction histidine kinase/CheY-like chemotaxis protein